MRDSVLLNLGGSASGGSPLMAEALLRVVPDGAVGVIIGPNPGILGCAAPPGFTWQEVKGSGLYARFLDSRIACRALASGRYAKYVQTTNYSFFRPPVTVDSILYVHDAGMFHPEGLRQGRMRAKRALFAYAAPGYRRIVVQTAHMQQLVATQFPGLASRIAVVFPEVQMPGSETAPSAVKPFKLLYPSTGYPYKREFLAEAAVHRLHQAGGAISLEITSGMMPAQASPNDPVRRVGRLSRAEVLHRMQASHAVVFTSSMESLGLPLVEAMLSGRPVVAPDLPYAHEIAGDGGSYFRKPSTESVAEAIEDVRVRYAEKERAARLQGEKLRARMDAGRQFWAAFFEQPE